MTRESEWSLMSFTNGSLSEGKHSVWLLEKLGVLVKASDASTFTILLPQGDNHRMAWGLTNDGADCWTALGQMSLSENSDFQRVALYLLKDLVKVLRSKYPH